MKKIFTILVLFVFTNFTVSPLFFSSSFFGKVTEERADAEGEKSNNLEEKDLKTICSFDVKYALHTTDENPVFGFSESHIPQVFIEGPVQPPEHLL